MTADATSQESPATGWRGRLRQIGPGIMAAATGVGAGDLVATMVAGSRYGYTLLWAVLLGTVFKLGLGEAIGRWHLASGRTILSGWRALGRWAIWFFGVYIVLWGFVYGATAMSASALPLNALFPLLSVRYWGILCGLAGLALVWFGRYALLERVMTVLVGVMFVTVVGTAVLVGPDLLALSGGLVPSLPDGSLVYVLGLMGGVGGTITMAAYGYWTMAKGWRSPKWLPIMRTDNAVGYVTTGIFIVAMLVVGSEMLLGREIISGDEGLLYLGDQLAADYGQWARLPFLIGFFAVTFTSLLGVWNGVSLLFADWWRTWRHPVAAVAGSQEEVLAANGTAQEDARQDGAAEGGSRQEGALEREAAEHRAGEHSRPFRFYVLWLTIPPMALLFLDKPFQITVAYGVLGALFMPFLAATLLVLLNSRRMMPAPHRSRWLSNTVLALCLILFAALAVQKLAGYLT